MRKRIGLILVWLTLSGSWLPAEMPPLMDYGFDQVSDVPIKETNGTKPRTVKLLGEAIARVHGLDRVQLVRDLGECRMIEGLVYLLPLLNDPDALVRQQAAVAVAQIGPPGSAADLKPLLKDSDADVRRQAVLSGVALGDASFAAAGLSDKDERVVAAGLSVAVADQAPGIAARLPSLSPLIQIRAVAALGRLKHAASAEVLDPFLEASLPLKIAALQALGQMQATGKFARVQAFLKDPHPSVRRVALLALEGVADVNIRQQRAIAMFKDVDPTVRAAAATILKNHPTLEGIAPLVEQLGTDYQPLHDGSREALLAVGTQVIPTAVRLLDHANPVVRVDGSWLLGRFKSDAGFDRHLQLIDDADLTVVAQASESLGWVGRPEAARPLAEFARKSIALATGKAPSGKAPPGDVPLLARAGEMAIVGAARLKYQPILPIVKPIFFQLSAPSSLRTAGVWAYGMLDTGKDLNIYRKFIAMQASMEEAPNVKIEAVKAIGNARITELKDPFIGAFPLEERENSWMLHWVVDRLNGQTTPFMPRSTRYANVSILDQTP